MLESALDFGINEHDYWEMTIGEVQRAIKAKRKIIMIEAKEKASYDYTLAQLITKGVGIVLGSKEDFPTLEETYPSIFADDKKEREDKIQAQKDNLSAIRFRQFAQSFNNNFNKGVQTNE